VSILRPYTVKDRGARRTVVYRFASGKTETARVVAANGANLDLYLPNTKTTLTNVPPATTQKSTGAWFAPKTA
jgi:hypothetical protein